MGLIDIIMPQSTVQFSVVNISLQKNSWECRESNPGLFGERQVCYSYGAPQLTPPPFLLASCLHFDDDLSLESISSWMEAANQMNQFLMVVQQLDERSGIEQKNDFLPFQQKKISQKFASRVENRFFARIYQSEQELLHLRFFFTAKRFCCQLDKTLAMELQRTLNVCHLSARS